MAGFRVVSSLSSVVFSMSLIKARLEGVRRRISKMRGWLKKVMVRRGVGSRKSSSLSCLMMNLMYFYSKMYTMSYLKSLKIRRLKI